MGRFLAYSSFRVTSFCQNWFISGCSAQKDTMWLGEVASVISSFYLCMATHAIVQPAPSMIIIIIIVIAFKGAFRDFLRSPHSAANCLQHVCSSGRGAFVCKSRATHQALITCKCHVTCHLVQRDSSAIKCDRIEIAFISASFYWLNH